ncbi:MAG: MBL fold metallo-hydrolase [Eubacteriales bacterium]
MKLCSIASGSSGNCIYVGSETTHILIDAGISKKKIEEGLKTIGLSGTDISALFVTHEHTDHIGGIGVLSRGFKIPIYGSKGTIRGITEYKNLGKMPEGLYHSFENEKSIQIGDLTIDPFRISHDAYEPTGFRITDGKKAIAIATDLGMYDEYTINKLCKLDAVFLEANHDVHMLEVGNYPYSLKKRVLSDQGHLSNELSGRLLCDILHDKLKFVILGHLSKENNYEMLAYETVKLEVNLSVVPFDCSMFELIVAKHDEVTKLIEL